MTPKDSNRHRVPRLEARMKELPSNGDLLHRMREIVALIAFAVLGGLAVRWVPRIRPALEPLTPVSLETLVCILIVEVALVGIGLAALIVHRTSRAPRWAARPLVEIKQQRGH